LGGSSACKNCGSAAVATNNDSRGNSLRILHLFPKNWGQQNRFTEEVNRSKIGKFRKIRRFFTATREAGWRKIVKGILERGGYAYFLDLVYFPRVPYNPGRKKIFLVRTIANGYPYSRAMSLFSRNRERIPPFRIRRTKAE
jgi:hypothetical protein